MLIPHQWKNKGILVPVYIIGCFVAFNILLGILQRNIGGFFYKISYVHSTIFSLLIAGLLTYFTSETYYYNEFGDKKILDIPHEFYWIKMRYWAYILWSIATFITIYVMVE